MGHPLPTSEFPNSGELAWFLVAIPDNRQFIQAALAAYTQLGKFWVWGKEGPTEPQSNDAADLFNEAISETLRAWEMSLLDTLIASVDEVEDKLDILAACCNPTGGAFQIPSIPPPAIVGDNTVWPIGPTDTMPPDVADIVSPVGGVSASYPTIPDYDSSGTIGETEFFDYRCAGSTFVLDTIINLLRWTAKAKRLVGDIADILANLAFHIAGHFAGTTPLGNILTILDMSGAATWPTLLNAATATGLDNAADQVEAVKETIRQELACGVSAEGALTLLQAALQGTITDAAALAFLTGGGIPGILVSMLWTATLDTGWSEDCECGPVTLFEVGGFEIIAAHSIPEITQLSPTSYRVEFTSASAARLSITAKLALQTKECAVAPIGTIASAIRFQGNWIKGDSGASYQNQKGTTAYVACPYTSEGLVQSGTGITWLPGEINVLISNSQGTNATNKLYVQAAAIDNFATGVNIVVSVDEIEETVT